MHIPRGRFVLSLLLPSSIFVSGLCDLEETNGRGNMTSTSATATAYADDNREDDCDEGDDAQSRRKRDRDFWRAFVRA